MKKFVIIFIIAFCSLQMMGQNITPSRIKYFSDSCYNGKVKVEQDAALKNFMETCVGLNKKRDGFPGYRVKVFAQNTQDARGRANAIRSACSNDDHEAYVTFVEPNFEVHVGDFMTRFEALVLMKDLLPKYPEAYIIKTNIKYPIH
ncbi:MAG: hypothetical protein IKJ56_01550 [Bacteroidales bacterium]|jgi:hypothetical protein|nr:hypothetical protein [Bacteroidales bacterium]